MLPKINYILQIILRFILCFKRVYKVHSYIADSHYLQIMYVRIHLLAQINLQSQIHTFGISAVICRYAQAKNLSHLMCTFSTVVGAVPRVNGHKQTNKQTSVLFAVYLVPYFPHLFPFYW